METVAVISDLHLGPKNNKIDIFNHDQTKFIKFLKLLENNFEKIYLNGDIVETLFSYNKREALFDTIDNYKDIFSRFFSIKQYQWIVGNHDAVAVKAFKLPREINLNLNNKKIHITHGHQSDLLQNNLQWVSELGVYIGGCMLRNGLKSIYNYLHSWDIASSFDSNEIAKKIPKGAIQLGKYTNADIIITGHSHVGCAVEVDNKLFLNSGTCSNGQFSFVSLNLKTDDYKYNLINF